MAQRTAVHIELRDDAWIVVREGNQRATSVHPTQFEAAESGREIARRDGAEFFLHGQDGQIREHRDYREGQTSDDEGALDTALGTVGTVADAADGITSSATGAIGADTRQESGPETAETREREPAIGSGLAAGEAGVLAGAGSGGTPEERYADYEVYDEHGERIGPISDLFVDDTDEPEYVGVEPGTITDRSVLVPAEVITIDDGLRRMVVSRPITVVETAPSLGYDDEVNPDFERRVRLHYALPIAGKTEGTATPIVPAEPVETGSAETVSGVAGREDEVRERRSEGEILVARHER